MYTKSTSTIITTRVDPTGIAIDKMVSLPSSSSAESVLLYSCYNLRSK